MSINPEIWPKVLPSNKIKKHLILIGMMGSGKTALGKALQRLTGLPWKDSDLWIEQKKNMTIDEIFQKEGESQFRKLEETFCDTLDTIPPHIITTGGGMILSPHNRACLSQTGTVFWLNPTIATLYHRLINETKNRPLLSKESLKDQLQGLLNKRKGLYTETSDYVLVIENETIAEISKDILNKWQPQT